MLLVWLTCCRDVLLVTAGLEVTGAGRGAVKLHWGCCGMPYIVAGVLCKLRYRKWMQSFRT